jgi:hypothetical protein
MRGRLPVLAAVPLFRGVRVSAAAVISVWIAAALAVAIVAAVISR